MGRRQQLVLANRAGKCVQARNGLRFPACGQHEKPDFDGVEASVECGCWEWLATDLEETSATRNPALPFLRRKVATRPFNMRWADHMLLASHQRSGLAGSKEWLSVGRRCPRLLHRAECSVVAPSHFKETTDLVRVGYE